MPDAQTKAWVCPICGYVHYGSEPPEECPVCGAARDVFELQEETEQVQPAAPTTAAHLVIVGAGIAGVSAAEAARRQAPQAELTLISAEADLPYYRLNLTRYLAGEIGAGQLPLYPENWYVENRIQLLRGAEVKAIDLVKKELTVGGQQRVNFDQLIVTVGASPNRPPFARERKSALTLRTRTDADAILEACARGKKCVCIGGGILGLETAAGLACRGADVTVLENQRWLLPRQLNETASRLFEKRVAALGFGLRTGAQTRELVGDGAVSGVALEDGAVLPAEVVVISAGVRPNLDLVRQAGLEVKQGLVVDDHMQTSHPHVWAAGDVADHRDRLYGLWNPARLQGGVAGLNAAGKRTEFGQLPRSVTLKVLGIDLFSIGKIGPEDHADRLVEATRDNTYFGFVFRHEFLAGAIFLGDAALSAKAKKAIEDRHDCTALLRPNLEVKDILDYLAAEV